MQAVPRVFRCYPNVQSLRIAYNAAHWRTSSNMTASVADRERQHLLLELTSQASVWGVPPEKVMHAVKRSPELLQYSPSQWGNVFSTLENIGFKGSETLEVMRRCPALVEIDPKNVCAIWYALTIFKLSTSKLIEALVNNPYVLCNSPENADDKALEIINFAGANNNALRILKLCNNPFALSLAELKEVTNYVKTVMKVRRTYEICRSKVVECPISKLKCRHSFLVDCGLYHPQDDDIAVTVPHSNALLCNIVDPSDENFATKTANMTYEEYLVYKELFELKRYDEMYGDDD